MCLPARSISACSAAGSRNFYAASYGYSVAAYRNHTLRKTVLTFFTNDPIPSERKRSGYLPCRTLFATRLEFF